MSQARLEGLGPRPRSRPLQGLVLGLDFEKPKPAAQVITSLHCDGSLGALSIIRAGSRETRKEALMVIHYRVDRMNI